MSENNKQIIIKIEEGVQTKAFGKENIIHKDAFERVEALINQNLEKAKSYDPTKNFERVHNTITINGERGAGKTSFMLSIKNEYEKSKDIKVLDILDPTLISTKQHVFILLISMIEKKVNEKFNDKCRENKYGDEYKKWKESLEDLAKGLNQLDGVGSNPYAQDLWDDSALVLAKGLSMAKAGLYLERKFHKFVYESLKILSDNKDNQKKAFLLFIDDIDTDFSKGWDVLEVLRKYITTPQIIPIMAGNFELYDALVRNEKSKLFKDLINIDKDLGFINTYNNLKSIYYKNQIDELTQQYLIKVLSTINRVNLHKLYYYITKKYKITLEDLGNEEIEKVIKERFENFFGIYYKEYLKVIASLPLRTILQWLYFAKLYENDKENFIDIHKDIFLSNFFEFGIDSNFFEFLKDNKYSLDEFTSKFITVFSFEELKEFIPNSVDVNRNIALMIIPQFLNLNEYLFYKLSFGIKVSLIFYIYKIYSQQPSLFSNNYERNLLESMQIHKYMSIDERIKSIFLFIMNRNQNNISLKFNFFRKVYKYKNHINLWTFMQCLNMKNKDNELMKRINVLFRNFNKEYEKNNSVNLYRPLQADSFPFTYDVNGFKKYLANGSMNDKQEIISLIEKTLKEIKNYKDILKSNNIWEKLPFFNIKNERGSLIYLYSSPLKIISLFIEILELLENKDLSEIDKEKIKFDIKDILQNYVSQYHWTILVNENNQIQEEEETEKGNQISEENLKTISEEILNWYEDNECNIKQFVEEFHIINSSEFYSNFYKKFEFLDNCCLTVGEYIKVSLAIYINEIIRMFLRNSKDKVVSEISSIKGVKRLDSNMQKLDGEYKKYIKIFTECPIFKVYLENDNELLNNLLLV